MGKSSWPRQEHGRLAAAQQGPPYLLLPVLPVSGHAQRGAVLLAEVAEDGVSLEPGLVGLAPLLLPVSHGRAPSAYLVLGIGGDQPTLPEDFEVAAQPLHLERPHLGQAGRTASGSPGTFAQSIVGESFSDRRAIIAVFISSVWSS